MKDFLIYIPVILLIFSSCKNGDIKSITWQKYNADRFGNDSGEGMVFRIDSFNLKGVLVKKSIFDTVKHKSRVEISACDEFGREIFSSSTSDNKFGGKSYITRDSHGNITEVKTRIINSPEDSADMILINKYRPDSLAYFAQVVNKPGNDTVSTVEYKYNYKGLLIEMRTKLVAVGFNKSDSEIENYGYDGNDNKILINKTAFSGNDTSNNKWVFEYSNNDLIKESYYNNAVLVYETNYTNGNGKKIKAFQYFPKKKRRININFKYAYY